jgi:hypothetical protein
MLHPNGKELEICIVKVHSKIDIALPYNECVSDNFASVKFDIL